MYANCQCDDCGTVALCMVRDSHCDEKVVLCADCFRRADEAAYDAEQDYADEEDGIGPDMPAEYDEDDFIGYGDDDAEYDEPRYTDAEDYEPSDDAMDAYFEDDRDFYDEY